MTSIHTTLNSESIISAQGEWTEIVVLVPKEGKVQVGGSLSEQLSSRSCLR